MTYEPVSERYPLLLVLAGALLVTACAPTSPLGQEDDDTALRDDATTTTFNRNRIIEDAELFDTTALTASKIDAFLSRPYPTIDNQASCLAGKSFGGKSVGTLVVQTAKKYGLSPLFLLTHLQKESSLIGNTASVCPAAVLAQAFGCGCPDGGSCDPKYAGFTAQLDCAGSLTRSYLDDLATKGSTISGWKVGGAKTTLDGYSIKPAGKAAAVLYTYTPWVGDHTSGGNAAPFGNYLFWKNWTGYAKTLGYTGPQTGGVTPGNAACQADADCNNSVGGLNVICSNTGATAGKCIDGCHTDADCAGGGACDKTQAHWQCTLAPPALGTPCTTDASCSGGKAGTGRVCGASSHVCMVGCHMSAQDCPSGSSCDQSGSSWACMPVKQPIGGTCSKDVDCTGGLAGQGVVCGASSHVCLAGCHDDVDCKSGTTCDHAQSPWTCAAPQAKNPIGASITASYDPAAAVAYADAHWNDGKGECAEFVSDAAVSAGHLGIGYSTWVPTTYGYLTSNKVPFDEYTPSHTSVRACPGDIVIDSNDAGSGFCVEPGGTKNCGHIGL
ncbi:MAG: hypothetical protein ACMG6S_16875, partial [Byssovorax sp.]